MKRPVQLPGQRDWAGDDLIELNSESLKAIEAVVAPYPMCVLSGCEVIASGAKYNISPGYVVLKGVGHDGRNVNRIVPFAGINDTILPLYLTLSYTTISDVYGDGKSKAISQDYKAMAATVKPGGDHLAITATGTAKLVDAMQDGSHRFITDSERTTWNGKETPTGAQAKANAALASAKSYAEAQAAAVDTKLTSHNTDSTRHITADERASWKAKETTTGAQAKADAALASAKKHISTYQMSARNHFIEDNSYWQQGQRDANNGIFINSANRIMLKKAFNTSSTHISVDRISSDYEIYMTFHTVDDIYIDCTRTNGFGGVFIDRYPSVVALPAGTGLVYVVMRKIDNSNITPTTTIGKRFMVTTSGNVVGWTHSPEDVDIMAKLNDLAVHSNDMVRHITDAERTSWKAKETPVGAQAKADAALASAKIYADDAAIKAADDVQVGGRNYALNTADERRYIEWGLPNGMFLLSPKIIDREIDVTITFWEKDEELTTTTGIGWGSDTAWSGVYFWYSNTSPGKRQIKVKKPAGVSAIYYFKNSLSTTYDFSVQTGDKEMDWSPAPEDMQAEIASTKADTEDYIKNYQISTRNYFIENDSYWTQGGITENGSHAYDPRRMLLSTPILVADTDSLTVDIDRTSAPIFQMHLAYYRADDSFISYSTTTGPDGGYIDTYPYVIKLPQDTATVRIVIRKSDDSNITPSTTPGKRFMITKGSNVVGWTASPEDIAAKATNAELSAHDNDTTRHITADERSRWNRGIQFAMGNLYDYEALLKDEYWTKLTGSGSSNPQVYTRSYKGYLGGINVGVALTNVAREFTIERAWALSKEGYVHCVGDGWVVKRRSDGQLIAMATDSALVSQAFLITLKYLK